jgi:hypothetical protein
VEIDMNIKIDLKIWRTPKLLERPISRSQNETSKKE